MGANGIEQGLDTIKIIHLRILVVFYFLVKRCFNFYFCLF